MYTRFFGLQEKPFSITPDPRYLFMSERHGEALAHLVYGVTESGGFVQLTGEVGTGKTTLVRSLLLNRMPDNADVAVVLNPQISALEFLLTICEELHIDVPDSKGSIKALTDVLNRHLLAAHARGRRTILVVDEAQNLAPAVLEQVRLLTNLETAKQKLLQIILIGQPELRELLARNDLRQLAQRITGRYHLEPLTREETARYIEHRLRVAGALGEVLDQGAKNEVFRLSQGVPRLINVICDRALLGAYSQETRTVNRRLIKRAAAEVSGNPGPASTLQNAGIAAAIVGVAIAVAVLTSLFDRSPEAVADKVSASETAAKEAVPLKAVAGPAPVVETHEDEPSLEEQIRVAGELTGRDFALSTLFGLWDIEYARGARNGCDQAADAGLACLSRRGTWNNVKQLNRPAIITVFDDAGDQHDLVLTAIHGETADLSIGGVTVTHPVSAIMDIWYGEYLLLWRPPGGTPVALVPGLRGPAVSWLRTSLANIDERYATDGNDEYDNALAETVRRFQHDYRLDVDGLAGQQTQIIINSLLGGDGSPRLIKPLLARD
ncbi:MAG TPA: AAA family ATPase [Woeseiaceae bacterium]|nr:AAA family ATPase [Woeseiaceae bacterium]